MDYEHRAFSYNYVQNQWNELHFFLILRIRRDMHKSGRRTILRKIRKICCMLACIMTRFGKSTRLFCRIQKNTVPLIKKISAAITATSAKTFKMEASDLSRDCGAYYSTQSIVAADHRKIVYLLCFPVRAHTFIATK